jgi:hypothetical protein
LRLIGGTAISSERLISLSLMARSAEILRRKKMQDANARVQRCASIMGSALRATPCREPRATRRRCCLATHCPSPLSGRRAPPAPRLPGPRREAEDALGLGYATRLLQRIDYNLSLDQSRGVVLGCRMGTASPPRRPVLPDGVPATGRKGHNFLRRSAVCNKAGSPRRSAW